MSNKILVEGKEAIYEEIPEYTRGNLDEIFHSTDLNQIGIALICLGLYYDDFDYALKTVFKFANHPNNIIRGNAILCIGYLAMRFKMLPPHPTIELIQNALDDHDPYIKDQAYAAASRIEVSTPNIRKLLNCDIDAYYGISPDENIED